ncbi:MAG: hypothetical protein HY722_09060 [Planctomycetes bacterium]|nr:hypothetical protein [Planctomycetota bacterium]
MSRAEARDMDSERLRSGPDSRPYAAPVLCPLPLRGGARVPGPGHEGGTHGALDGTGLRDLVACHGSPLYVLREAVLADTCGRLRSIFESCVSPLGLRYSAVANPLPAVQAMLRGAGVEGTLVGSGWHYRLARLAGVPADAILFEAPGEADPELTSALEEGARPVVATPPDLARLASLAGGRPLAAGLRICVRRPDGVLPKSGVPLEGGEAHRLARRMGHQGPVRLTSLHASAGTSLRDPAALAWVCTALADFALWLEGDQGMAVDELDLGGGLPGRLPLQGEPVGATPPPLEDFAAAVERAWRPYARAFARPPRLVLTPGRALVEQAMDLLTSVVACKRLADGTRAYIVDGGVNLVPTAWWYRHPIEALDPAPASPEESAVLGPLCMQIDVLGRRLRLPALRPGSLLAVRGVGAYGLSQSMQFIYPRPAAVLVRADGEVAELRPRETTGDLRERERVPEHLRAISWETLR